MYRTSMAVVSPLAVLGLLLTNVGCREADDSAAAFPSRSMRIICPWSAGGGTDRITRFFADTLREKYGRPCTAENKTGAGGAVGHNAGATAKPDGYTLTMITFELSTMKQMGISRLTHQDFHPLVEMNADPAALVVRNDAPWKTLDELLAYIREHPGELRMSGTESGGAWDLARAGLMMAAGVPVEDVIWVPKRGSQPSLFELLGGHIEVVCCSLPEASPSLSDGQLRPLVVMADERLPEYPDVPTAKESGVDWSAVGWRGLAAPKDTPDEICDTLETSLMEIIESAAFQDFMTKNEFHIEVRRGQEFRDFLAQQELQWQKLIESAGFAGQAP